MDEGAISCEGLTRRFASGTALDALDLTVAPGEVIALLGPNGAGKTTTVRLLNGVLRPDAGRAQVLGLDPWAQGEAVRHRTGVLTEQAGLDERFTALENLEFAATIRGLPLSQARSQGAELLERLGMGQRVDTLVRGFSTGERKRVALARALLHHPDLLFLDEPTSGLDPTATRDVVDLIGRLASEEGRTVVLCTHFLGEAGALADRMTVLIQGRLHAVGAPAEIAAEIWSTRTVEVVLAGPATEDELRTARTAPGVEAAEPRVTGLTLEVTERGVVPAVMAALVASGAQLFGVRIHEPSLEDVYFAVEARAVLAADSFAGEKERRTLETLLHLPVSERDLYVGKLLGAFLPAVAVSWIGFVLFTIVSNAASWGVLERTFLPTSRWMVLIVWIAPATAALGLGIMVRVSIRSRNNQEAQQLGGAVVLPLTVLAVGQTTYLLLYPPYVSLVVGAVLWLAAGWLNVRGARAFTRDRMAAPA